MRRNSVYGLRASARARSRSLINFRAENRERDDPMTPLLFALRTRFVPTQHSIIYIYIHSTYYQASTVYAYSNVCQAHVQCADLWHVEQTPELIKQRFHYK